MKFITSIFLLILFSCGKEKMVKKPTPETVQEKKLSLQDILFNPDFRMSSVRGTQWTPDGNGYVYIKRNSGQRDLVYYDIESGNETIYIAGSDNILEPAKREKRFSLKNFYWSPANTNEMLIPKGTDLYLYYQDTKKLIQLTNDKEEERDPRFSPDGKKIAYLKNKNLYVLDIASKKETELSKQGTDKVLIGRFDWVYEEEFSIRTGFFWSKDSKEIAYFELTDAETDRFPIVDFIPIKNTVEQLPYPKAGADNSTVRIASVNVRNGKTVFAKVSSNKDELIPRIKWTNNPSELLVYKMNRDQDYLELHKINTKTGRSKLIFKEEEKDGWIDINDDITFIENDKFIWRSRKDGYNHLYLMNLNKNDSKQLTSGNWEITQVHGYDKSNKLIYFTAAKKSSLERELYSVSLNGNDIKEITKGIGYHRVNMSPNFKYFLDYFSNITTAPIVDLMRTDGSQVRRLRENTTEKLVKYNLGKQELLTFKTSDGVDLNAYMIKPHNFNPNKKYPVLMFQYSGPGSQQVKNAFSINIRDRWHHMLSQNDIIIFCTDGRGTGYRGRKFEQITNHDLGNYETLDQKEAATYLRSLPYVKKDKIGIWGWSYGGYMSSLAITKYPDDFNLAIAVAPVTNWKNYDTIYTERFMSTPKNNPNYDKGAPMHYAGQLKNPFLLIHGTADDNVHLSNAMQLVLELVKNQKQFDHFFYPRSMHGMTYDFRNTYPHLYTMMTNFVLKHLK